jgi:hypothetical protein
MSLLKLHSPINEMQRFIRKIITTYSTRNCVNIKCNPIRTLIPTTTFTHPQRFFHTNCIRNQHHFDEDTQYVKYLLQTIDDLYQFQEHVETALDEHNYSRAIAILKQLQVIISENQEESEETALQLSSHNKQDYSFEIGWNIYIHKNLMYCFWSLDMNDYALKHANELLKLEKECIQHNMLDEVFADLNYASITKADILAHEGDLNTAIQMYSFVINSRVKKRLRKTVDPLLKSELKQELLFLLECRGDLFMRSDMVEEAIKDYSEVISKSKSNPSVLVSISLAKLSLEQFEAAEKDAKTCLECTNDPLLIRRALEILHNILVLTSNNNWVVVIEKLTEYIRLYPSQSCLYARRAEAYSGISEHELALADCHIVEQLDMEEAFSIYPTYLRSLRCLCRFDDLEKLAQRMLRYAKQSQDEQEVLAAELAQLKVKQEYLRYRGLYKEAIALNSEIKSRTNPDGAEYRLDYAHMLCFAGRSQDALDIVQTFIDTADVSNNMNLAISIRALVNATHKNNEAADMDIQKVIQYLQSLKASDVKVEVEQIESLAKINLISGIAAIQYDASVALPLLRESVRLMKQVRSQWLVDGLAYLAKAEYANKMMDDATIHEKEVKDMCPDHYIYSQPNFFSASSSTGTTSNG